MKNKNPLDFIIPLLLTLFGIAGIYMSLDISKTGLAILPSAMFSTYGMYLLVSFFKE